MVTKFRAQFQLLDIHTKINLHDRPIISKFRTVARFVSVKNLKKKGSIQNFQLCW